ncbi:MAG: phospholipase D-like domain-containing protein [Alphaproteobacteria bacterium]|jgi:cardiolipin synthase
MKKTIRSYKFYHNSSKAWQAIYQSCRNAKKSIYIEQYIFEADIVGKSFIKLLSIKAKQGVKVKVLCDWFGSINLYRSRIPQDFKKDGGEIYFYRPISIWQLLRPSTWFPRVHHKLFIIDNKVAYVGSMCLDKSMLDWRDTAIRLNYNTVKDTVKYFEILWESCRSRKRPSSLKIELAQQKEFNFYANFPQDNNYLLCNEVLNRIHSAKKYIYMASPYFMPTKPFFSALKEAVKRGVEIILIIPKKYDSPFVYDLACSYYKEALRSSIKILRYKADLLHAKYIIIDDNWSTLGSLNFDYLSLRMNNELNVNISNLKAVAELKKQCLLDFKKSELVKLSQLMHKTIWRRLLGLMFRKLKKFILQ